MVGLAGTSDQLDSSVFTRESLIRMLERLGVNTRDQVAKPKTKNVAAAPSWPATRVRWRCPPAPDAACA